MKGYTIEHLESPGERPCVINQHNFHQIKNISFYSWSKRAMNAGFAKPSESTVAIFKIKWKQ